MKSIEQIKTDYNLFIDIQMGKYLKQTGKTEFESENEAKHVLDKIVIAYNEKVASEHHRPDNSELSQKTAWFNSIEINFKEETPEGKKEFQEIFNKQYKDGSKMKDERFPFLPKGSIEVLVYAGPALDAFGLPFERYKTLILGEDKSTGIEEDLLIWAFDITVNVMGSLFETAKTNRERCYREALEIAEEKLSKKDAKKVLDAIAAHLVEENDLKKKKKRKK